MQKILIFLVTILLGIWLAIESTEARDKSITGMTSTPTVSANNNTGLAKKSTKVADNITRRRARRDAVTQDAWIRIFLKKIKILDEDDFSSLEGSSILIEEQVEPEDDLSARSLDTRSMDYLKKRDGNFIGYFQIPKVDINVPTYRIDASSWADSASLIAQNYTNKKDSAVLLPDWEPFIIIADHVDQSFERLHEVNVGTVAIIKWYDNTLTKMRCVETGIGINDSTRIIGKNGLSWDTWRCDFVTYTCYHAIQDGVFYAKWVYDE